MERSENIVALLRFLRALRPLRAIQQWENTRIIVNSFIKSIPQILNVLVVCFIFWLTFAIAGVNLMKGKFAACYYLETDERVPLKPKGFPTINKEICLENPEFFVWRNFPINFDNTGTALLALLQVATFEGWMEVMQHAVDMPKEYDQQPSRENAIELYFFFFAFIICGSFFTLNLFIGVIIDNFNSVKESISQESYRDIAFSENQAKFLKTVKRVLRDRPKVKTVASNFVLGKLFHAVVHRLSFDLIVPVFIFLDLLSQAFREDEMSETKERTLFHFNFVFTSFYLWEFIIRVVAMRKHVGMDVYIIDLFCLASSILGIGLYITNIYHKDFAFVRFLRIYRIGRAFKQFKFSSATRIRKLLLAFVKSGASLVTICLLMFIFLIIFALVGMKLFQDIEYQKAINDRVNFRTFQSSMYLLFRLLTVGGWNDILDALMCDESEDICREGGNCPGNGVAVFYMVSWVIIMFLVIVNMYVAVILKYFDLADDQEQIGVTEDDYEIFLSQWQHIDPKALHFIDYSQLSDFVAHIKGPLQIGKPNSIKLINLRIPMTFQDKVHVVHVFEALLAHFLKPIDLTTPVFTNALKERHESLKSHFLNLNPAYPAQYTSEERFVASRAYTALQKAYINYKFAACLRSVSNPKLAIKLRKEIEDCMVL